MKKLFLLSLLLICVGCSNDEVKEEEVNIKSGTYEVGDFSLEVPDGWLVAPFYINGTEEVMTDAITIYKNADDPTHAAFNSPGLGINFSSSCSDNREYYDEVEVVKDVVFGDMVLSGFRVNSTYPMTQYITTIDDGCLTFSLWQDREEGTIDIDEKEVEFIIESIKITVED